MKKYEIMYIVRATLDQEATKKVIADVNAIFTSNKCEVLETKEWGLRELAYEIEKQRKGYYVVSVVNADAKTVAEFNRICGYNENVLRYIATVYEG